LAAFGKSPGRFQAFDYSTIAIVPKLSRSSVVSAMLDLCQIQPESVDGAAWTVVGGAQIASMSNIELAQQAAT
jgi:hypothetical protein